MTNSDPGSNHRKRMTGKERREQLLDVGRRLFAERGFEGTSIEEIAAQAPLGVRATIASALDAFSRGAR